MNTALEREMKNTPQKKWEIKTNNDEITKTYEKRLKICENDLFN